MQYLAYQGLNRFKLTVTDKETGNPITDATVTYLLTADSNNATISSGTLGNDGAGLYHLDVTLSLTLGAHYTIAYNADGVYHYDHAVATENGTDGSCFT